MTYVIPHEGCRLGNWLYYYAVAVSQGDGSVAIVDNGVDARAYLKKYQKSFFQDVGIVDCLPDNAVVWKDELTRFIPKPVLRPGEELAVHGFFQKLGYIDFEKVVPRLRMSTTEREKYMSHYSDWLNRPHVTAIHVRRGDYLCQQYRFPFVGKSYFKRAISRMSESRDFMVFSDDIEWCKAFFPKTFPECNFLFVEGGDMIDDFRLQSLCRHNIISNSSYSWWAAQLNENPGHRILVPSLWAGFEPRSRGSDNARWLYNKDVEIIDNDSDWGRAVVARWQFFRREALPRLIKGVEKMTIGRCAVAMVRRARNLLFGTRNQVRELFDYDYETYMQYSGAVHGESKGARLAEIAMAFHVIEKGLTMPRRRYDFGHEAVNHLMFCVDRFAGEYGDDNPQVKHAVGVVREYLAFHRAARFDESKDPEYWHRISDFDARYGKMDVACQLHLTSEELFSGNESPFPVFAASRHTCRHFEGVVPLVTIKEAVRLAMTAPSACNRQHVRVHCISRHKMRDGVLALQNGNRGFGSDADKMLVITSDLQDLRWNEERNDIYTNAGIFIMNLSYALHYYRVASCILNWSVRPEQDREMHKLVGIPGNERIVALVACGPAPSEVDIATSPRKALEEIFTNHV